MHPIPEPQRETPLATGTTCRSFNAGVGPSTAAATYPNTATPSKRKASSIHEQTPAGKLPKPSKGVRTVPVHTQERQDLFSIPLSPPSRVNPARSLFRPQRQRESTHDTDATWMPRETTAETETVVGGDEVTPGEVGECRLRLCVDDPELWC